MHWRQQWPVTMVDYAGSSIPGSTPEMAVDDQPPIFDESVAHVAVNKCNNNYDGTYLKLVGTDVCRRWCQASLLELLSSKGTRYRKIHKKLSWPLLSHSTELSFKMISCRFSCVWLPDSLRHGISRKAVAGNLAGEEVFVTPVVVI